MQSFKTLKQQYLNHLKIKNFSNATILKKDRSLQRFFDYLSEHGIESKDEVTEEVIKNYQEHRYYYENKYGKRDSVGVQNAHLMNVRGFFRYLYKYGYLYRNPAENIELAKVPQRLPKLALTDKEMKKILRKPDESTPWGYRDRTMLEVLYSTGVRCSELSFIKVKDVSLTDGLIRINQGKGSKDRMVPIGRVGCKYLEGYLKFIRPKLYMAEETEDLFIGKNSKHLGSRQIRDIVKRYAREAKINKEVSPHTFRRTCATEMIKHKANPMYVKELLGHKGLETIKTYCNLTIVDLKKAHQKYHPREKLV